MADLSNDESHTFLRINSNASTRLTVSAFLGGITFTTFAVLVPDPAKIGQGLDSILLLIAGMLLSCATLLFLLTAATNAAVLICLSSISSKALVALREGRPIPNGENWSGDKNKLEAAQKYYRQVNPLMPWGLVAILVSMLPVGFHVHYLVGLTATILLIALAWQRDLWIFTIRQLMHKPLSRRDQPFEASQVDVTSDRNAQQESVPDT